ncbi:hypothetical protein YC2023_045796 [Brassica napus]
MARRPGGCGLTIPVSSSPLGVLAECVVIATRLFRDVYRWCFRTEVVLFFPGFASFRWLAVRFASPISFTFPCLACNVNVNCKLEEIVMN